MFASLLFVSLSLILSLLASPAAAQTAVYGFCFTNTNKPGSPYGPWSVATYGTLTVNSTGYTTSVPVSGGGGRLGYSVLSANAQRVQLNRDGSTSTATLQLCPVGLQGSDNVIYSNSNPSWLDWDGICFSVTSSSNSPPGTSNWIVYPNDFPSQQVEIYSDLPALAYPSEYHTDNSTNGVITVQPNTVPSCTPAPLIGALQTTALTFQFCYQAYAAASGSTPAWQVAIQGTLLTANTTAASPISGQSGMFIYTVTGTRTQSVGGTQSSVSIVGQTFHNSGTTNSDKNEYNDDPLLTTSAPYLVPNYGFVLYTGSNFTYPNGVGETVNNAYAKVTADPLWVASSSGPVVERDGPTPDWSAMAVSCGCSVMSCPLITSSGSAAVGQTTLTTQCNAVSSSTSVTCNAAHHTTIGLSAGVLVVLAATAAMLL